MRFTRQLIARTTIYTHICSLHYIVFCWFCSWVRYSEIQLVYVWKWWATHFNLVPSTCCWGFLFSWLWPCLPSLLDFLFPPPPLGKRPLFLFKRPFKQYLKKHSIIKFWHPISDKSFETIVFELLELYSMWWSFNGLFPTKLFYKTHPKHNFSKTIENDQQWPSVLFLRLQTFFSDHQTYFNAQNI